MHISTSLSLLRQQAKVSEAKATLASSNYLDAVLVFECL